MVTNEYLDEERIKLWKEVEDLKKALEETIKKMETADLANNKLIVESSQRIQKDLESVKSVAVAKTPEDVMTARRAAQDAVLAKDEAKRIYEEAIDLKNDLPIAKKAFKTIKEINSSSENLAKEFQANKRNIDILVNEIVGIAKTVSSQKTDIENKATVVLNVANMATSNAQEVANLKAKASEGFAELLAQKTSIEEMKDSLVEVKSSFLSEKNDFGEKMNNLYLKYDEKFKIFFNESEKQCASIKEQINSLLPGATSIALATAFDERKQAVQKTKWWWATVLIISAICIAAFGFWSLNNYKETLSLSAIPLRLVIIAAFVMVEEFARRNYNVTTRLAEASAYKAAIAPSFFGFKKELDGIKTPDNCENNGADSISVLAKTFLDKLADEPDKRVFDKERRAVTLLQAMAQLGGSERGASSTDKTKVTE